MLGSRRILHVPDRRERYRQSGCVQPGRARPAGQVSQHLPQQPRPHPESGLFLPFPFFEFGPAFLSQLRLSFRRSLPEPPPLWVLTDAAMSSTPSRHRLRKPREFWKARFPLVGSNYLQSLCREGKREKLLYFLGEDGGGCCEKKPSQREVENDSHFSAAAPTTGGHFNIGYFAGTLPAVANTATTGFSLRYSQVPC